MRGIVVSEKAYGNVIEQEKWGEYEQRSEIDTAHFIGIALCAQ